MLVLALAFYVALGILWRDERKTVTGEYEVLLGEIEFQGFGVQQPQLQDDADMVRWLEKQAGHP